MKNALSFLSICVLAIISICAFLTLPCESTNIAREKYSSWAGVVRIWLCDDMEHDPYRWINECADAFESAKSGVYLSVQRVSPSAIAGFTHTGINPPDMIIWPAGLLSRADGLCEIHAEYPLRAGLDAHPRAVPLLTDAYAWIHAAPSLPADMHNISAACSEEALIAMTALSTGLRQEGDISPRLPGVDLGLSGAEETPLPSGGGIFCRASSSLVITDEYAEMFLRGECAAFPGNIRDIRAFSEAGFSVCVTGEYAFTGRPVLCSIVERDVPSAAQRRALCEDFLTYLMTDGQQKARLSGAMPAAAGVMAYSSDPVFSHIESALAPLTCVPPPFFGEQTVPGPVWDFIYGRTSADRAIESITK